LRLCEKHFLFSAPPRLCGIRAFYDFRQHLEQFIACPLLFIYLCPGLKKALAILLTFSIIAQGMVNLALCTYYQVNKKEITAKLCVNKDKPQMHCNGQCYLGKQLKKAEENEKRQNQSLREKDEVVSLCHEHTQISYIPSFSFVSYTGYYIDRPLTAPHIVPDQPPRV
jgi:hypothetical protein